MHRGTESNTRYCIFFKNMHIAFMTKKKLTSKSFRFDAKELKLLEEAAKIHGSYKQAIMAGLDKVLTQGRVSKADVQSWIDRQPDD